MKADKFDNITLSDWLSFSPYDFNRNLKRYLDYNDFKEIRIVPQSYIQELSKLKIAIDKGSNYKKKFYIVSGYSGSGKTTFIHWCKEELEKENYWFDIINLISTPTYLRDENSIITRSTIKSNIELLNNNNILLKIIDSRDSFVDYFSKEDIKKIEAIVDIPNRSNWELNEYLRSLSIEQNLFLYVFSHLYNIINENNSEKKSYIFCLDNLDELNYKYLTSELWKEINTLSSTLTQIGEDLELDFDFQKQLTFILVFREANLGCICAQRNDLIRKFIGHSRLIYPENGKDIISKRLKVYKEAKQDANEILSLAELIIDSDSTFSESRLCPLFNYDIRKLSEALINMKAPENKQLLDFPIDAYNKIESGYKYIKRGILFNCIIKYLSIESFFDKLSPREKRDKDISYANTKRMMLIVFSNLSYPTGFKSDNNELNQQKPEPFSIVKGFEPLMNIIEPEEYCKSLNELLDLNTSSKTHLITIYGKTFAPSGNKYYFDFKKEVEILKKFKKNKGSLQQLSEEEQNIITSVNISLNATAFIYLKYILSHFEYMSTCKTGNRKNTKALTLLNYINSSTKNWMFIEQIEKVYKAAEGQCNNIINFYNERIKPLYPNIDQFKKSELTFKGGGWDGFYALHIFRTISCHITYIDTFRVYLYNHFDEYIEPIIESCSYSIELNTKEDINNALMGQIKKYIDLHFLFLDDNDILKVGEKLKIQYKEALKNPEKHVTTNIKEQD